MASGSTSLLTPEDVLPSLTAHNASFVTLLNLIPPNYYLSPQDDLEDDEDEQAGLNTKYMKNKRKAKEALLAKSAEKKEKKRAKLDPANLKTVSQVQQERAAAAAAKADADEDMDFDVGDLADGQDDGEEDGNDDGNDDASAATPLPSVPAAPVRSQQDSITSLRERLQNKIASMQNRRRIPDASSATGSNMVDVGSSRGNGGGGGGGGDASFDNDGDGGGGNDSDSADGNSSVASTRDELLEERRRRRGEVRDNRRRARKEMRRQAMANSTAVSGSNSKGNNAASGSGSNGGAKGQTAAPGLLVRDSPKSKKEYGVPSTAPTDLNFSSFQMPGESSDAKKKRDKNALPSNPKQALAMLEARKAREAAKASDGDGGEDSSAADDGAKWSKALSAAKGVKIRDDEALLRKSLKRKEKAKQKSATEWKDRAQDLKDKEAEKQKKRTDNLKARKDAKMAKKKGGAKGGGKKTKDRKLGGSGAKGGATAGGGKSGRAGFEGKKVGRGLKMAAAKKGGGGKKK